MLGYWLAASYLVAPSLTLVRSRDPGNRETGIGRVSSWHSSDAVLPTLVAQGGSEALLSALPEAQPATRLTILELLVRMAPIGDAQARLASRDAASHAAASCTEAAFGTDTAAMERCQILAAALGQVL